MQTKTIEKYFLLGLLVLTIIFTFFIFRPFWIVLILGGSLSIVIYPVYKWFKKIKIPNTLSALITVLLFIIVLCIPVFTIGSIIFNQSQDVYYRIVASGSIGPFLSSIGDKINLILPKGISFDVNQVASTFISFLTSNIREIFSTTLSTVISFILLFITIFYFLKDGDQWKKKIISLIPLSEENDNTIVDNFRGAINGVIKGYLLIALIQGILMWIGLSIFGVPNGAFWGLVAAVAAIIPPFGTGLISVPAVIFLFFTGHPLPALGLLVWGAILVGTIDNFLSPYIVGKKLEIPPFLILFSVLGGIALLGPVGILIGPLVVSMLHTLISIYKNESLKNKIL